MSQEFRMSLQSKKELMMRMRACYAQASTREAKQAILTTIMSATGYHRKYVITLLNAESPYKQQSSRSTQGKYDEQVKRALLKVWHASNQICSKRLVPFIPTMLEVLEKNGYISLADEVKEKLHRISTSTVDRLLKTERHSLDRKSVSTTGTGQLLKNQIKVRTFSDWHELRPGFLETDLVAHCGGDSGGSFVNTLTLTDIESTWTECLPLLYRSAENVIKALSITMDILPFAILGIDVDNGREFINYALVNFCKNHGITLTRSRAYKKNDQAHVEERNGSIVRRLVGYDRFEGDESWQALAELYGVVRLYVNFFQPSLKLVSKSREGAKVRKKYDVARTPYQRLLDSLHTSSETKSQLRDQYNQLDPVSLLAQMKEKQQALWKLGVKVDLDTLHKKNAESSMDQEVIVSVDKYKRTKKAVKQSVRVYGRTRPDPFEEVREEIEKRLISNPSVPATELLDALMLDYPGQFTKKQKRTLQRRVAFWRKKRFIDKISTRLNESKKSSHQGSFVAKILEGAV